MRRWAVTLKLIDDGISDERDPPQKYDYMDYDRVREYLEEKLSDTFIIFEFFSITRLYFVTKGKV
jgi:hypothetical protein